MKRRILSILCVLAVLLGMITAPAFAESKAGVPGNTLVLSENAENLIVEEDTNIDLNGYSVAGVTVADDANLYVYDSRTDDYTVADGVYGKITEISGDVQAAEGYLAIAEEEAVSFHKVDLSLKSMALRPAVAGVYYNSSFAADEVVAANVEYYGVALSIAEEPTAENLDSLCGYSVISGFEAGEKSGTLLTGVMEEANTAEENAANAAMPVYGRAYIKTSEGYTFGECVSRDLKTQVEAIDAIFDALTDTQKSGILAMYETYKTAMEDWNIPNLRGEQLGETVITVPVQTENGVVTESVTVEENGISVTIPFGTLVEKTELTLQVTKKEQSDSGIEAEDDQTLMPFDVHMDGISSENTVPLTVALGKVMPENLNMGNYTVYHVEETGTNAMELVAAGAEFSAHNQYKYTLEGELTLYMATFSEVAVVSEDANIWNGDRDYSWYDADVTELYIRNADQLAGFGAIVGGMDGQTQDSFNGKTVKLLADIAIGDLTDEDGRDVVFYPIGYNSSDGLYEKTGVAVTTGFYAFMGTFDGNGNTISDFYQNTWEMKGDDEYYAASEQRFRDGMGLFGKVYGGTVKNLTVNNFQNDGEYTTTGVIAAYADSADGKPATFENIAIVNCNPRVYNIGNGGIVGCGGWYSKDTTVTNAPITFKNITVDNTNKISALWGSWDVACGGIMGQYYPNSGSGVSFENCHVAAQIDVYNDVCANYQYYAYRYAGMIIGSIRENETIDGHVYPKMDGITATGCTVEFDSWNDYYYCELVANSLASYTHDHQFSRLVQVKSVEGTTVTPLEGEAFTVPETGRYNYVVVKTDENGKFVHGDENATCYHFVDGAVWDHTDAGEETVNGQTVLKEDKQHIYREFKQLFTGYGWGVTSKGLESFGEEDNIKVTHRDDGTSFEKFAPADGVESITNYTTITIGELFTAAEQTQVPIVSGNVQVTVSPADPADPNNSVAGVYTPNTEDWTKGTLTLTGVGTAKVTITDYDFCIPTSITVNVVTGGVNDTAVKMTFESVEADGKVSAFCPACAAAGDTALKDWYPMPVVDDVTSAKDNRRLYIRDTLHHHYYLDEAVDYTKNTGYYAIAQNNSTDKIGTQLCLNLNGQVIVSEGRAFFTEGQTTLLNIMGDGQVTGNAFVANDKINWRGAIDGTSPINLYGGTYISGNDAPAVSMRGGSNWCTVTVYEDVTLQASAENGAQQALFLYSNSNAVMYGGTVTGGIRMVSVTATIPNLTVSGAPVIDKVTTNGYLITVGELTPGASITVDAEGIFTGELASAAAATAALPYFHMVPKSGYKVAAHYKSLAVAQDIAPENVLEMADLMDFSSADAETGAVTALCPACGLEAQWLPLEPITAVKKYTEGAHHHFYLSTAKDYTGNRSFYQFSDDAVCIHLNGQELVSTARAFMSEKANSVMNIMGTGTVTGCGTYNGTIENGVSSGVHNFFGGAVDTTSIVNLYGGTFKGGDSDAIVSSRGGGTKSSINVYGAQIVRTANDPAGLNVYVSDNGQFNLYSGTVSGGTAVSHMEMDGLYGGNILAKAFHNNNVTYRCEVNIYGGTITGGTAETKGGNIAVMGNSYARPSVTLNILGGTVTDGSVYVSGSNAKLNLSGAPEISELDMTAGNVADVSGLTEGADITVNAETGVPFTAPIAENAQTIAAYFASTDPEQVVAVTGDNALIVSAGLCPHCNVATELITWTELTSSMVGKTVSLTGHYYMSGDISGVAQTIVQSTDTRDTDFVIDLRGNAYSSTGGARCFYVRRKANTTTNATLSIIDTVGGGTITGKYTSGGGTLYTEANATINMYAGTVNCEGTPFVGGAIYVAGTFNLYDGTINGTDVTANTVSTNARRGGAAYVTGGTLNVYGGTINAGIANEGDCIYAMNTCKLNFYGGTVNGEIVCSSAKTAIKVAGAPVVTDLNLLSGQKLTVDGALTNGASITVNADGVFTGELADPAAVKDFFHTTGYKKVVVEGSALAVADMSTYEAAAAMDFTTAEADGKVTAVCPVCQSEADWYPMPVVTTSSYKFDTGAHHYYLDPNVDYTKNSGYYGAGSNTQVCLNLNGQDVVSSARALWNEGSATVVNIMGDGSVTGNGYWVDQAAGTYRAAIDCTAALNLYGGTYESANEFPAIQMRSGSNTKCVLGVYEGTVIKTDTSDCALEVINKSTISIYGGSVLGGSVVKGTDTATLTISGNPVIEKLDLSNGQTVTVGTMTEGASIAVLAPDNVAFTNTIEADAEAYIAYFHAYALKKGVEVQENALVITDVCPHCGVPLEDIEWTLIEETGKTHKIADSGHYKLAAKLTTASSNAIQIDEKTKTTGLDVVLDTSGFNIDAGGRSFFIGKYNHFTVFDSVGGSVCSSNSTNGLLGGSGFTAYDYAVVNVYDITLNGASDANGKGNCISVYGANTVVNIYSGTFNGTDCTTSGNHGGTVYNHGTLNIYGGTLNDADVTDAFGGCLYSDGSLYIENAALNGDVYIAAGTVEVAGTAVIAELQLAENMKVTVGELRNGASIAVDTDAADGVFTAEGNGQYQEYFSAVDNENCWVEANANGALAVKTRALEAGFGRVSVTPDYEVKLAGGAATRMATECEDDLAVTCVALKEGGETYLVCSMDFITANNNYVAPAKKAMSAATGVPVENIIMNATHTHSSVDIRTTGWDNQAQYLADFCAWAAEAATAAVNDLAVATVSYGSTNAEKLTWVRHYLRKDGTYTGANYGMSSSSAIVKHAYEADTEMQMIRFSRVTKAADVILMNFPCHATNEQTETVMSADFPYYFRKFVEEHDTVDESGNAIAGSKDVLCAYFMAAAGDQVHSSRISGEAIITDYKDHGEKLGRYAVALLDGGTMTASSTVGTKIATKTFTGVRNCPTEDEYNAALEVKAVWDTLEGGRGSAEGKAAAIAAGFESVYQVSAIINNYVAYQKDPTNSMELKVMSIGGIGFIFAPYEMFAQQGVAIKDGSPFEMTFIVTCSDDHEGYLPSVKGWEMDSYESHVTHYEKGTAETLAEEYVALLKELKEQ